MSKEEDNLTFSTVTLARLFHTVAFDSDGTRITQKSLALSAEYLRMFTREAILRANEVRSREAIERRDELQVRMTTTENDAELDGQEGPNEEHIQEALSTRHLRDVAGLLILDF